MNTGVVAFVYAFDPDSRRLDAFDVGHDAKGARIGSVMFSPAGEPEPPALDLLPEERVREMPLSGPMLSLRDVQSILDGLPRFEADSKTLEWWNVQENVDGSIAITLHTNGWEGGLLSSVVEQTWNLIPFEARSEPDRIRHLLEALHRVAGADARLLDAFWIATLDPLRRSGARQRPTFEAILRAHAVRHASE